QVVYCTYVGGTTFGHVRGLAFRDDGRLVLTGYTDSRDFRTTPGAYRERLVNGNFDSFVWILDPSRIKDEQLAYGTLFGGTQNADWARSLALDPDGVVTIGGFTWS